MENSSRLEDPPGQAKGRKRLSEKPVEENGRNRVMKTWKQYKAPQLVKLRVDLQNPSEEEESSRGKTGMPRSS